MYTVLIEAVQDPESDHFDEEIGGAFVKCYFRDLMGTDADEHGCKLIREYGWIPIDVQAGEILDPEELSEDSEHLEFVQEALGVGESLVFHTWPAEELD